MTIMYDGISSLAAGIARQFPNAVKVAGYLNGTYAWSQEQWNLFPHADHVTISVTAAANAGDVLDVETGDAGPEQAAGWIAMRKAAGLWRPTIYCSRSVIPAVRAGTGSYVLGKDYDIWVADYTGQPHQVTAPGPGAPAALPVTQYESTANWDASAIYDDRWPHRKPPGTPAPAPSGWPAGVVLGPGDHGAAVKVLQAALDATHLVGVRNITVNGTFGDQTETSVRNFQVYRGLTVDGIAGPATRAALGIE